MKAEFLCKNYCCAFCFNMACIRSTRCDNRIKPSNADRIRAMSDEELAEELYDNINIDCCSLSAILNWLKQEVE